MLVRSVREGKCIGSVCVEDRCDNGVRDGDETDVDCGGGHCPRCGLLKLCQEDFDCVIGQDGRGHCGSIDLGDGQGFQRRCAECFQNEHCPIICSVPFCDT